MSTNKRGVTWKEIRKCRTCDKKFEVTHNLNRHCPKCKAKYHLSGR